jgi:hypothetical protein
MSSFALRSVTPTAVHSGVREAGITPLTRSVTHWSRSLRAGRATRAATAPRAARPAVCAVAPASSAFEAAPTTPITSAEGQPSSFPPVAGVYAIFDPAGTLQYIGISRKISVSVATHIEALPELVGSVKLAEMPEAGKDELTDAWRQWVQEAGE